MITTIQVGEKTHFDQLDSSLKTFWDHPVWLKDTLKKSKTRKGVFILVVVIAKNFTKQDRNFQTRRFFQIILRTK